MVELAACKMCQKPVSPNASSCPHCGEPYPTQRFACPKCSSTHVSLLGQQGFSVGKAVAGAVLFGPLGLAGGAIGSKDRELLCLDCGHRSRIGPSGLTAPITVGAVVNARVTAVVSYGAIVDLGNGLPGLIHISNLSNRYVKRVEDVVAVGDEIAVRVLAVDARGRFSLRRIEPT